MSEKLTPGQEAALHALLEYPTVKSAAKAAGLERRTVHRYLRDPVFLTAYRTARRRQLESAVGIASRFASESMVVLGHALRNSDPRVRIRAAKVLSDFAARGVDTFDAEERLQEIERRLDDYDQTQ